MVVDGQVAASGGGEGVWVVDVGAAAAGDFCFEAGVAEGVAASWLSGGWFAADAACGWG